MWISDRMNTRRSSRQSSDDCILLSSDSEIDLSDPTFDIDEVVDLTASSDVSIVIVDSSISPQVRQRNLRRRRRQNSNQQRASNRSMDPVILNAENTSTDESFNHWRISDEQTNEQLSNEVNSSQPISEQVSLSALNPDGSSIDNQVCPLCLETYKEIKAKGQSLVSTTCGHVFCKNCSRRCLNGRCPTCRKKLNARSIHPLYL